MSQEKIYRYGDVVFIDDGTFFNGFFRVDATRVINDLTPSYTTIRLRELGGTRTATGYREDIIKKCISNDFQFGRSVTFKNGETGTVLNKIIEIIKENGTKKQIRLSNYNNALVNLKNDDYTIKDIYLYKNIRKDGIVVSQKFLLWDRESSLEKIKNNIEKVKNLIKK